MCHYDVIFLCMEDKSEHKLNFNYNSSWLQTYIVFYVFRKFYVVLYWQYNHYALNCPSSTVVFSASTLYAMLWPKWLTSTAGFFCINYFKRIKSKLYAHLKYRYNWGAKKIGYPTGSRPPAILITRFFLRLSQLKYKNYTLFSLKC